MRIEMILPGRIASRFVLGLAFVLAPFVLGAVPAIAQDNQHGIWRIDCSQGPCQAFFNIKPDGADAPVLLWAILNDPQAKRMNALIRVRPGVALPPGMQLEIGDQTETLAYQVCDPEWCTAIMILNEEWRSALEGAETARIGTIPYGGSQPRVMEVPVTGAKSAMDALETR